MSLKVWDLIGLSLSYAFFACSSLHVGFMSIPGNASLTNHDKYTTSLLKSFKTLENMLFVFLVRVGLANWKYSAILTDDCDHNPVVFHRAA